MPQVIQLLTTHCIITVVHASSSAGWTLQPFNTTIIIPDLKYDNQPCSIGIFKVPCFMMIKVNHIHKPLMKIIRYNAHV